MLLIASAVTALAVLLVVALVACVRLGGYSSAVYRDEAAVADLRAARRASGRVAA